MDMQWNWRGSGTGYVAWYNPEPLLRFTPLEVECCLDSAEWQYWEPKAGKEALMSGRAGGVGCRWDAVTHSGQKHNKPAFREWQVPAERPWRGCDGCTAYGNNGGLLSLPFSPLSLKIKESTRKDLGMLTAQRVLTNKNSESFEKFLLVCSVAKAGRRSDAGEKMFLLK